MSSSYIDIPTAARALGKSTDAVRKVVERHLAGKVKRTKGRTKLWVRLVDVKRAYENDVVNRGWEQ